MKQIQRDLTMFRIRCILWLEQIKAKGSDSKRYIGNVPREEIVFAEFYSSLRVLATIFILSKINRHENQVPE